MTRAKPSFRTYTLKVSGKAVKVKARNRWDAWGKTLMKQPMGERK